MTELGDWASNSPCCCAVSSQAITGITWEADIEIGFVEIQRIEFLGRNGIYFDQSDDLEISVQTLAGWESCGITSNSNLGVWQ